MSFFPRLEKAHASIFKDRHCHFIPQCGIVGQVSSKKTDRFSKFVEGLELKNSKAAKGLRLVKAGHSIRAAANQSHLDESSLRYHLKRSSANEEAKYITPAVLNQFFEWCDKQKEKVTVDQAQEWLRAHGIRGKSERSIHRYIQEWKDSRGKLRRHWSCGGSKWD